MNRQASIATSEVLDTLPSYQADLLAQKFIEIYKDPVAMVTYLSSPEFAQDILKLAGKAKAIFEAEQVLARDRQQPPPQHARARAPNIQRLPMTASTRQSTQAPPTARCERGFTHMACAPPPPRPPSPRWDPLEPHPPPATQRCLFLESPIYVFGDTHGNLEDLHFFSDNIWKLGINLSAGRFLFLGECKSCVRGPEMGI